MEGLGKGFKAVVVLLVVLVVALASLLALYAVPARSAERSWVWQQSGSGAWNGSEQPYQIIQSPHYTFSCPPSDVVGNATLSFVWNSNATDTNGALAALYGFPIRMVVLYGVNASAGGYSVTVGTDSPICQGEWYVGFYNTVPYQVTWSLAFFYNYTTTVPIL